MKLFSKILFFLFVAIGTLYRAQPTNPPSPPGGGGGVGPGAPASPIDMYLYLLAIVAFGFMWYYHAKTRKTLG